MTERIITLPLIQAFRSYLRENEKSERTVSKYLYDVKCFRQYAGEREIDRETALQYKNELRTRGAISSANSAIAALNAFFRFCGWDSLRMKQFKVQKNAFSAAERELSKSEYTKLVHTAEREGNERLALLLQTICGTGIRVSELEYITVEAAERGETSVSCKGKTRVIFLVSALRKKLLRYARKRHIAAGSIFRTRGGKTLNRTNIWKEMKRLCRAAGVPESKVFPHNLRHLFARTFYALEKDLAKLADILGHSSINTTRIYIAETGDAHLRRMETMRLIL